MCHHMQNNKHIVALFIHKLNNKPWIKKYNHFKPESHESIYCYNHVYSHNTYINQQLFSPVNAYNDLLCVLILYSAIPVKNIDLLIPWLLNIKHERTTNKQTVEYTS